MKDTEIMWTWDDNTYTQGLDRYERVWLAKEPGRVILIMPREVWDAAGLGNVSAERFIMRSEADTIAFIIRGDGYLVRQEDLP
jgi:hypothetical protein